MLDDKLYKFLLSLGYSDDEAYETVIRFTCGMDISDNIFDDIDLFLKEFFHDQKV